MSRTTNAQGGVQRRHRGGNARRIGNATFNRITAQQVKLAGPRYTPGEDPSAPNLEIRALTEVFDALGFTQGMRQRVRQLRDAVSEEWGRGSFEWIRKRFRGRRNSPTRIIELLSELSACDPVDGSRLIAELQKQCKAVMRSLRTHSETLQRRQVTEGDVTKRLESRRSDLFRMLAPVGEVREYLSGLPGRVLQTNTALLLGPWGTGKTHTLCDLSERRRRAGEATLLLLAQDLPVGDPRVAIARRVGVASLATTLRSLERLGRARRSRSLLCLDAINEGDRPAWRSALRPVLEVLRRYPHVGLVLSCRTPFDREIVDDRPHRLVTVHHPSFEEAEADAQLAFFNHYNIPAPSYPLIMPEFTRALFLKLFCQSIEHLSRRRKELFLGEVVSGQAGMTTILESVVKRQGRSAERLHGLPPGFCWDLMKGTSLVPGGRDVGLAPLMAHSGASSVTRSECLNLIRQRLVAAQRSTPAEVVLQRLVADGLLVEVLSWEPGAEARILFPYERFGEHLIARHLLREHLDLRSPQRIRRSFYANRPLGRVFETRGHEWTYARQGLASAIMLEFPERTKNALPRRDRELAFMLPKRARGWRPVAESFLDGLQWRHRDSFNETTDTIIAQVLKRGSSGERNKLFDDLLAMGCRSSHPYSSRVLWRYLSKKTMAERDLTWSEAVRSWDKGSALDRLLDWCEKYRAQTPEAAAAQGIMRALALTLTTTVRPLRDRVTKVLFDLGRHEPKALFDLTIESLEFNDPYVPERLLAASYGVAMHEWTDRRQQRLQDALPRFARRLARQMLLPRAPFRTCHALMNDYAFGLVALAGRLSPRCIPSTWQRATRPPLLRPRSPFRDPATVSPEQVEQVESALHMDFDNYTLGSLVEGRRNYDSTHNEYQQVRTQVLGRMHDLGYRKNHFEEIDRLIGQWSWRVSNDGEKTDRYGKKYSWIAFFEMYGIRGAAGVLSDYRDATRPAYCDIDPSFPGPLNQWRPPLPDILGAAPEPLADWISSGPTPLYPELRHRSSIDGHAGSWTMLDGFIHRENPGDPRTVFTFVRALFVRPRDVPYVTRRIKDVEYLGNVLHVTPDDVYTFAGEVPWSAMFGKSIRTRAGKVRAYREALFHEYISGQWKRGRSVEVPVRGLGWESYHSTQNQNGNAVYPAPALCERLGLLGRGGTRDLYDSRGRLASLYRVWNDRESTFFQSHVLYLRRDLLRRYLRETAQVLMWVVWGERSVSHESIERLEDPTIEAARAQRRDAFCEIIVDT